MTQTYDAIVIGAGVMGASISFHLAEYIRFYNFERPHQALDYLTPAQVHGACKPSNSKFGIGT